MQLKNINFGRKRRRINVVERNAYCSRAHKGSNFFLKVSRTSAQCLIKYTQVGSEEEYDICQDAMTKETEKEGRKKAKETEKGARLTE